MTAARCDVTDLLVDQCAHCLGHKLDVPALYRASAPFTASYAGRCLICKEPIESGSQIVSVSDDESSADGYAHEGCP